MKTNKIGIIIDDTKNPNYILGNSIVKFNNVYERVVSKKLTPATQFGILIRKYKIIIYEKRDKTI